MRNSKKPGLISFVYNHNPFYLISAGLVLYGIRSSFQDEGAAMGPWLLAGLFAGYISLLAVTSVLIVKFGRVWDDARSIFMVLLLLFLALSVSFDAHCIHRPSVAIVALVYAATLVAIGCGVYVATRDKLFLCSAVSVTGLGAVATVETVRMGIAESHRPLVMWLAVGLGCFAIGVLVSCLKAGLARKVFKEFNRMMMEIQTSFRSLEES